MLGRRRACCPPLQRPAVRFRPREHRRTRSAAKWARAEASNAEALAAFIARKAEIDRLLEQLLAHSHEHLNLAPEEVHWGHVGELDDWLACLRRVAKLAGILAQDA